MFCRFGIDLDVELFFDQRCEGHRRERIPRLEGFCIERRESLAWHVGKCVGEAVEESGRGVRQAWVTLP